MQDNHPEAMSLADVAAHVGLSKGSVSRYFSNITDGHVTGFVNRVRVNKACEPLSHGDSPTSSICHAVGFNTLANFNRRFREIRRVTPGEFRDPAQAASATRFIETRLSERSPGFISLVVPVELCRVLQKL